MDWVEIKLDVKREKSDDISGILLMHGVNGFVVDDKVEMVEFLKDNPLNWDYVDESLLDESESQDSERIGITFYLPFNHQEVFIDIKNDLNALNNTEPEAVTVTSAVVDDADWLDNWKKYYKPFKIGEQVMVVPVWENYTAEADSPPITFTINPGSVFGTGLHQTTQLCVEKLEKISLSGTRVLDLGCGTGILSLIALLLSADSAVCIDIEPTVCEVVNENASLNKIEKDRVQVISGNILTDDELQKDIFSRKYEVILANIVADVILALIPVVRHGLSDGGIFICSGIIDSRVDEVRELLEEHGYIIMDVSSRDDWYCISAKN